jgi:sugar fermentation stimulation protein A
MENGETVTAHCPNSGSMRGCATPGSKVFLSLSDNPKRKYRFTWELVYANSVWVGINTGRPNRLVHETISQGRIPELDGYSEIRPEVRYGANSRIDLLLSGPAGSCYVEVKNVTLADRDRALFPDAVTARGQKHLQELMGVVRNGGRGIIFFVVQREDTQALSPADTIDPEYGRLLRMAVQNGVEALAYQAAVSPLEIVLTRRLPIILE